MSLHTLDHKLTCAIHNQARKRAWLDKLAVFTARDLPFVLVALPFVLFFKQSSPPVVLMYILLVVTSQVSVHVFQQLIRRKRPFQAEHLQPIYKAIIKSASFPSGHAALVATVITFVMILFRLNEPWLLCELAVLGFAILLARVYGGMHYVSDILAGLLFGSALTSMLLYAIFNFEV